MQRCSITVVQQPPKRSGNPDDAEIVQGEGRRDRGQPRQQQSHRHERQAATHDRDMDLAEVERPSTRRAGDKPERKQEYEDANTTAAERLGATERARTGHIEKEMYFNMTNVQSR